MYHGYKEVHKEVSVLVNFAWVTWPERPKGAKDEVKRPAGPGPPARLLVLYKLYKINVVVAAGVNTKPTKNSIYLENMDRCLNNMPPFV